ncbi:1,4-alpha-glucan-branching enzyme [Metschnikowia bicuspidata var. bicuspidata NRRL YB-4993]|uniref:1,4-alpha-glucan-branching enzyme n=1 Tax=Metschnikowia bicuspidata var. bicuspidata NRRL YB-4993 TaxID=869754 RepID=A0A1A0GZ52_9ASCO|nr:1,4-alpha-glucan-branching enzyme [Metschnikowia bicuspidata var. bicuspidata NRRL YB-4993]OBA16970.1 1,4-alpha-glucan-branching enzyme [Metschnikowia bicuspidata var. bicuspidata NRRL YB-4993]
MSDFELNRKLVKGALDLDPWLEPHANALISRQLQFKQWQDTLTKSEASLSDFASSYEVYGLHADKTTNQIVAHEYIPDVVSVSLVGDFNNWDTASHVLERVNEYGLWKLVLPPTQSGDFAIEHDSRYKLSMVLPSGERIFRLDPWGTRATPAKENFLYEGRFWNPPETYTFQNARPRFEDHDGIKIYEAHVGISSPEPKIASYKEFSQKTLPIIHKLGYNTIQLMAVMEHAYYASFGYQVTNFFAVSSRYGTPEELKELVDHAHKLGIRVLLDVVHSHSSKNVDDGLNNFNGTDHYLFHGGSKGNHDLWDSRLFNYSSYETLRFLLSNLKFFVDVYQFDGFRFDGVTSMLYKHHGLSYGFSGDYNEYFNPDLVENDAITYLMLAHKLLGEISVKNDNFKFISIAEDVSGMPTLCLPIEQGGIGFDYRLSMAIPDMWIKILKHLSDEQWDLGSIVFTLTNRRHGEKCISYCESHDQALVGDKTLAFWLMDKDMYTNMSKLSPLTDVVSRGIALHKMIRLLTFGLGGEGYLNFMGNEFGHPEWLDFPREGNNESYHYARRQFNLIEDDLLRYRFLFDFDAEMLHLDTKYGILNAPQAYVSLKHEGDKVVVFERAGLLFIFNFHPTSSFPDYKVGVETAGEYQIVLNSDTENLGGFSRINDVTATGAKMSFATKPERWNDRSNSLFIYIPSRTALVLQLKEKV